MNHESWGSNLDLLELKKNYKEEFYTHTHTMKQVFKKSPNLLYTGIS